MQCPTLMIKAVSIITHDLLFQIEELWAVLGAAGCLGGWLFCLGLF